MRTEAGDGRPETGGRRQETGEGRPEDGQYNWQLAIGVRLYYSVNFEFRTGNGRCIMVDGKCSIELILIFHPVFRTGTPNFKF
jgi:hypothetical protein